MSLTLQEIALEVGEWSKRNFGSQKSKRSDQLLHSIAPLLGMVEELGEFADSVFVNPKECEDALGDIGIYLCDFAQRDGADFNEIEVNYVASSELMSLASPLGKLAHCVLKSHQGIRGFNYIGHYIEHRNKALSNLLLSLQHRSLVHVGKPFIVIVEETWQRVKLRDWQKNKDRAHLIDSGDETVSQTDKV